MSVEELTQKAIMEINKIRGAKADDGKFTDTVITNAVSFGDNVLKTLISHTVDVPVDTLFDNVTKTIGSIVWDYKEKKYLIS